MSYSADLAVAELKGGAASHFNTCFLSAGETEASKMEEKKFFEDRGVTVTNARFIVSDQTYAMSGITSVKSFRQDPSRTGPIICGIVGLFLMLVGLRTLVGGGWVLVGLIILAGAVTYWFGQKTEFSVLLTTASGEVKPLHSRDGAFISKVVSALNDSIVHRG